MCCNDSAPQNVDLKSSPFDEIKLKVNNATLKFDDKYHNGEFRIFDKGNPANENQNSQLNPYQNDISLTNKKIEDKNAKIIELKNKINEIDNKLGIMRKILNIDVSEQEYLKELTDKLKEQNPENKAQ